MRATNLDNVLELDSLGVQSIAKRFDGRNQTTLHFQGGTNMHRGREGIV
jgi:hypothetical protein